MSEILSQDEIDKLLAGTGGGESVEPAPEPQPEPANATAPQIDSSGLPSFDSIIGLRKKSKVKRSSKLEEDQKVNVQPATFPSFDITERSVESTELGTILNIDLEVRVELGSTQISIREVLDYGSGSVIELDRLNGEPVDIIVNKKLFAKGEMIVIGENFGARITDIINVHEIIEALR